MIDPKQLRHLVRLETAALSPALATDNAVELIMLTFAAETECGRWLWQHVPSLIGISDNLAYGIGQMEAPAYQDATRVILRYKPSFIVPPRIRLITDLRLAIWTTRAYYLRFIEPIPHYKDAHELAKYWKRYWNTPKGAGTVEGAEQKYNLYATER